MKSFIVEVSEVHTQTVTIQAENEEEAIALIKEGGGTYVDNSLKYSHTLDPDAWVLTEGRL